MNSNDYARKLAATARCEANRLTQTRTLYTDNQRTFSDLCAMRGECFMRADMLKAHLELLRYEFTHQTGDGVVSEYRVIRRALGTVRRALEA